MDITIAVCTHNRADQLQQTLSVLGEMEVPTNCRCEILIVDNASTDTTCEIGQCHMRLSPHSFRYVFEPITGLSRARNRAIDEANSDIIIFLDDDATPHEAFLKAYMDAYSLAGDSVGCIGGKIDLELPKMTFPWWFGPELHGFLSQFDLGDKGLRECKTIGEYPYGANMSFYRKAVIRSGYFNENLGFTGRKLVGGEEEDLCIRLHRIGYKIMYQPRAVVTHHIQPERVNLQYFQRLAWANGMVRVIWANNGRIDQASLKDLKNNLTKTLSDAMRLCVFPPKTYSALFRWYLGLLDNISSPWYCLRSLES